MCMPAGNATHFYCSIQLLFYSKVNYVLRLYLKTFRFHVLGISIIFISCFYFVKRYIPCRICDFHYIHIYI